MLPQRANGRCSSTRTSTRRPALRTLPFRPRPGARGLRRSSRREEPRRANGSIVCAAALRLPAELALTRSRSAASGRADPAVEHGPPRPRPTEARGSQRRAQHRVHAARLPHDSLDASSDRSEHAPDSSQTQCRPGAQPWPSECWLPSRVDLSRSSGRCATRMIDASHRGSRRRKAASRPRIRPRRRPS